MDAPPVSYVTTSDGYSIAYGASGEGTPLIFMPGSFDHVQLAWRYPSLKDWVAGLASRFRLIQFDPRGSGMSTRGLPETLTATDYQRDIEAVVSALNLEGIVFLCSGYIQRALRFALSHPERVTAIIISSSVAYNREVKAPSLWFMSGEDWDIFLNGVIPRSYSKQEAELALELLKQSYGQQDFARRIRSQFDDVDAADLLVQLKMPTLVLHSRDYPLFSPDGSMAIARLARGRMALIDGNTNFGDAQQGLRVIEAFLADIGAGVRVAGTETLSSREVEVLRLIAAGRSNQQIADELVISLNTVRHHVSNIFDKTGATNRVEAATYARDQGLA